MHTVYNITMSVAPLICNRRGHLYETKVNIFHTLIAFPAKTHKGDQIKD